MNKRVFLIGLLLLLLGIVISGGAVYTTLPSASEVITQSKNLSISAGSYGYLPMPLNQTSGLYVIFNSTQPVTFIFANSSAFYNLSSVTQPQMFSKAEEQEGKGVLEIFNGTTGSFPYSSAEKGIAVYFTNVTFLPAGNYFLVFINHGSLPARVELRSAQVLAASIAAKAYSNLPAVSAMAMVGSFLALIGIILMVASLFMHGKKKEQQMLPSEVEQMYEKIEKSAKRGARHDSKHRSKSS